MDSAAVYLREVTKAAREANATALILPNHPSGDPTPSSADITATAMLASAAQAVGPHLHNQMIAARGETLKLPTDGPARLVNV
jgi:DNA repair protein RadC